MGKTKRITELQMYRNKIQEQYFDNYMNHARLLRNKRFLTDISLECEGFTFEAHKIVLAVSSSFFKHYFAVEKEKTKMTIDFMEPSILRIILDYLYSGKLNLKNPELLKNVLEGFWKLKMNYQCEYCLALLLQKPYHCISPPDWKDIEGFHSEILNEIFWKCVLQKIESSKNSKVFLYSTVDEIQALVCSREMVEFDQSVLLQFLLNWVKYDVNERKEHLTRFLENVHFDKISPVKLYEFKDESLLSGNIVYLKACSNWLFKTVEIVMKKGDISVNNMVKLSEALFELQ